MIVADLANCNPVRVAWLEFFAAYIEAMQHGFEKPSVKQHLAAIRMLFD